MLGERYKGEIVYANLDKGFLFVKCSDATIIKDVFIHLNDVINPVEIELGRTMEFVLGENAKGYYGMKATVDE